MLNATKTCRKCRIDKSKSEFYTDKRSKDGLNGMCKACACEQKKLYYAANSEAICKQHKEYQAANAEDIKIRRKALRVANREAIREMSRVYRETHAEAIKERKRAHYVANSDAIIEQHRGYQAANSEAIAAYQKAYREANAESISRVKNLYKLNRRKTDPLFALSCRISRLVLMALSTSGYSKKSKTYEILGCTYEEFAAHIESLFQEGMSWDNRNEWHLDHIYPVSKAGDEEHLIKLNHYTNFQPLWAFDNLSKSNKLPETLPEYHILAQQY